MLQQLRQHSQWASPLNTDDKVNNFIIDVIAEACTDHGTLPGIPLGEALFYVIKTLLKEDSIIGELPNESDISYLELTQKV